MMDVSCEQCGSQTFTQLGILGDLCHLRCRACGWNTAVAIDDDSDDEDEGEFSEHRWQRGHEREQFCAD